MPPGNRCGIDAVNPRYRCGYAVRSFSRAARPRKASGSRGAPASSSYATNFAGADQNPLSQGGEWAKAANSWQAVRKVGNIAKPAAYTEVFDDAYSLYRGAVYTDCEVIATIFRQNSSFAEFEILLRASDSSGAISAVEMLCNTDGGVQIMRWNGALGDFTEITGSANSPGALADGHQLRATVIGNQYTYYHRSSPADSWTQIGSATDSTYTSGRAGLAFYVHQTGGNIDDVGFRDWSVTPL
jgi:hypothetical protein